MLIKLPCFACGTKHEVLSPVYHPQTACNSAQTFLVMSKLFFLAAVSKSCIIPDKIFYYSKVGKCTNKKEKKNLPEPR